ncbi:hypothetical protein H2248_012153 [Termitomyces sp. 'cryptogamus']|nr:hypothetical protein H2248_012153 [Termitomyces sp. 'cryptogamus']
MLHIFTEYLASMNLNPVQHNLLWHGNIRQKILYKLANKMESILNSLSCFVRLTSVRSAGLGVPGRYGESHSRCIREANLAYYTPETVRRTYYATNTLKTDEEYDFDAHNTIVYCKEPYSKVERQNSEYLSLENSVERKVEQGELWAVYSCNEES